ncbi:hypothetical protein WME98_49870 [Sorangium sp. So ce296]|uniref:hypothetical protein n=1 Tax=Sorangium sp. So ce296 TaxID=3133296 RepID=UPI003F62827F
MTAAPVVQRVGFKSGRSSWDWLKGQTWSVERRLPPSVIYANPAPAGPTLGELATMHPRVAMLLFGVAVIPLPILRLAEAAPAARRPEPRRPRTALGGGVVPLGRALSPSGGATEACGVLEHTRGATAPNARPASGATAARELAREREQRGR